MTTIAHKVALATVAFAILGAFGTPAPADQPGSGHSGPPGVLRLRGEISGDISFATSLLPHGYNSKACSDFSVIAQNTAGTTVGKSGKLHATRAGHDEECGYSIPGLAPGTYTVVPQGHPRGFKGARCGGFDSPEGKSVTLRVRLGVVRTGHANFVYSKGTANECAAPTP